MVRLDLVFEHRERHGHVLRDEDVVRVVRNQGAGAMDDGINSRRNTGTLGIDSAEVDLIRDPRLECR